MDTLSAFARGQASQGKSVRVFDWEKAARRIREVKPRKASAGLRSDWEWTGGTIYAGGQPVLDDYTYLASTWATPELDLDGDVEECWRFQKDTPGWDSSTKWPPEALAILKGEK